MATLYTSESVDTTLTATLNASTTTCTVADAAGLLGGLTISGGNTMTLAIDPDTSSEEIVILTGVSSNTLTITRAQAGTSDVSHSSGAIVRHVLTSIELTEFATKTGTETFTNKTLTAPVISTISNTGTLTLPTTTDTLVGRTTTDTLTNKTIALGSNTVSGTIAEFNTAVTDADLATIAGTETLTNKTLTSASLSSPSISNNVQIAVSTGLGTTGTIALDFATEGFKSHSGDLTGNITYTASNYAAGRSITVRVPNGSTLRTLTFPTDWKFVGTKPANIAANKTGILTVTSFGTTEADCVAAWAVQV